jgi:hypothetical protein
VAIGCICTGDLTAAPTLSDSRQIVLFAGTIQLDLQLASFYLPSQQVTSLQQHQGCVRVCLALQCCRYGGKHLPLSFWALTVTIAILLGVHEVALIDSHLKQAGRSARGLRGDEDWGGWGKPCLDRRLKDPEAASVPCTGWV